MSFEVLTVPYVGDSLNHFLILNLVTEIGMVQLQIKTLRQTKTFIYSMKRSAGTNMYVICSNETPSLGETKKILHNQHQKAIIVTVGGQVIKETIAQALYTFLG